MGENTRKEISLKAEETGKAVAKQLEQQWLRDSRKPYNVCIIGQGQVGKHLCEGLIESEEKLPNPINKIYLLAKDGKTPKEKGEAEAKIEGRINDIRARFGKFKFKTSVEKAVCDSGAKNSLEDILVKTDVVFISLDATPDCRARYASGIFPPRMESTLWNLSPIKELAEKYFQNYAGNVIIVSNLTDVLSQVFAMYSGMDSRKIIGMNHIDVKRYQVELERELLTAKTGKAQGEKTKEMEIDAYVTGPHNDPVCLVKYFENKSEKEVPENARERINQIVTNFGPNLVKSGTTTEHSTAHAAIDTLTAIINEYQTVTASVPYEYEPGKWVYIGLPVEFKDGHAVTREDLKKTAEKNPKFIRGVESLKKVPSELRNLIANREELVKHEEAKNKMAENEEKLYAQIDELEEKMRNFKPKTLDPTIASLKKTPRIVAAGENLIVEPGEDNVQKYHSEKCIRTAKILTIKGEQYLALGLIFGGHDAVELRKVSDLSRPYKILRLKENFTKIPGFASIVSIDDLIFASHSEAGLFRWNMDNPNGGERIYDAKGLRHLNVISRANSPYLLFATEEGAEFSKPDLKNRESIKMDGQNVKVTSLYSFEGSSYIGTKVGKERYAKGHVQAFVHDGKENKAETIRLVTLRKPNLIYAERIFGEKYIFVASPPGNLVAKNLDSMNAPFFLKYPEAEEVEGITCIDDSIYVASGKNIYKFNLQTKEVVGENKFEQNLMSIVKFGG